MKENFSSYSHILLNHEDNNFSSENLINHFLILEENTSIQRLIKTILLDKKETSIGRSEDNDIILSSLQVSRSHCYLIQERNEDTKGIYYIIIDGDKQGNISNNGLIINQKKVSESYLKHGDIIEIGSEVIMTYFIDYEGKFQEQKIKIIEETKFKKLMVDTLSHDNKDNDEIFAIKSHSNYDYRVDELLKFASIVNLSPHPIIEIDIMGNILFANACAKINFPNLLKDKLNHPLLQSIIPYPETIKTNLFKREVKVNDFYFEEYIHYLKDLNLVRLYIFDVTARNKQKENLKQILDYDLKTKLPNYRFFIKTLQKTLASYKRTEQKLAVMLVEIDQIYLAKDTLTENTENHLLKYCSEKLTKIFRLEDTVAYWRENQFIILLSEINDISQIGTIAKRVIKYLNEPFISNNKKLKLNINIGISIYPHDDENDTNLIRKADQALAMSKKYGENQYSFYSPKINYENQEFIKIKNELNHALTNEQLTIYYQPIINRNNSIVALESLIYWHHQYKGLISSEYFMDIAENIDLINEITLWVLERIIYEKLINIHTKFYEMPIAINVSHKLFKDKKALNKFIKVLEQSPEIAKNIIIEIQEISLVEDEESRKFLKKLLSLGIKITLDDFGVHNSSFNNLKKFPFHYVKIAQDFVKNIKDNSQDKAIVSAIITMAKGFNMEVIAEGIENNLQWIITQELDCEYGQGYLFCKPLPFDEINQLLNT
ncbi:EAL domain-containing protein [Geminocystis sp. NIES-3709]|uniref:EAL domain-containing protein n=1 Tax=Geminocystis sp. NIES-3709 TaxID=1617448 RepID=UPI0005FC712E|nr:EAL domain-containing protein [Geminocystis sp. NIES-3709]BAQ66495.1 diguanylate cyclase/phosphodiesterase with PAS/PAC sensor [Geminocystis sp. NIES-3709]